MSAVLPETVRSTDPVEEVIRACPKLASLRSINATLQRLLAEEDSHAARIAAVIRRDPSLTARVLRLVNSVFYGLSGRVSDIEEAIFYLGLREIRTLALATPVIEEMRQLAGREVQIDWEALWRHNLTVATLSRELYGRLGNRQEEERAYIAGLLHDVGKLVMAHAFPAAFVRVHGENHASAQACCAAERACLGWDHGQIGAHYLRHHRLEEGIVEAALWHNTCESPAQHPQLSACVRLADCLARVGGANGLETGTAMSFQQVLDLPVWSNLCRIDPSLRPEDLEHLLDRLPAALDNAL